MVIVSSGAHRWASGKGQGAAGGLASGAGAASQGPALAAAGQGWGIGKWKAYAGSKLCGVLYAAELTRRYGGEGSGVVGVAVRPGTVATGIARHSLLLRLLFSLTQPLLTSVEEVGEKGGEHIWEGGGVYELIGHLCLFYEGNDALRVCCLCGTRLSRSRHISAATHDHLNASIVSTLGIVIVVKYHRKA